MPAYEATIQLKVQGQDRLKYVLDSVEKINAITSRLKPISLLAPGKGPGGDAIRVLKKELDDFARAIVNFKPEGITTRAKELSTTLAGSAAQAGALSDALSNVSLKSGGFKEQAAEVKNYSLALLEAESNAKRLTAISDRVRKEARIQAIASRFGVTPAAVEERLNNLRDIRYKKDREADAARFYALKREEDFELRLQRIKDRNLAREQQINKIRQRTESISLGVGFPLLFGGGVGSVAGSLAGSFLGETGFGGQILLGAIGQRIEDFVRAAAAVTESTETISETLKLAGTSSEAYIQALERAGRESEAYTYALDRLTLVVGSDGVKAFKELQKAGETFNRAFAEITTSILALAAQLLAGAAQGIAGAVEETALFRRAAVSEDPRTKQLLAELQSPATGFQSFLTGGRAYDDLLKQIIERQRELEAEQQKSAASVTSIVNTHKEDLAVLNKRKELAETTGDLTSTAVIAATKELYALERQAEQQKLYNDYATDAITIDVLRAGIKKTQIEYETKLLELVKNVSKAREVVNKDAQKAAEAAQDLTQKLQRQLELATATTSQDRKALQILFEYEDNVKAIRELEDQSQAARQLKIADELYSVELNKLAADELDRYLDTLTSIAAVSPGLGVRTFQGTALEGAVQSNVGLAFGTQANLAEVTPEEAQLQKAKDQLAELVAPINMVQTAAQGVGAAFTDSFKSVIDGTATTQEALSNMFSRIGDAFLNMAAQIITQLLVIKAIESAISIFGTTSSFKGFSGSGPVAFPSGLNLGSSGFMANGGAVKSSTPYLVGERGPELFVPGMNGGVMSNSDLRSAMGAAPGSANGSPTLNMSFETTNIAGVEYVSREQLEAAMVATRRQATRDGAKRGMSMTLDRIQQSPQTRNRLGIG